MATSLQTRPRWLLVPTRREPTAPPTARTPWVVPTLVLAVALVLAACLYTHFLEVARSLWYNPYHDRNAHYLYTLKLATDVSNGRVFSLLNDLNQARVWPPLHGLASAGVLLVGGCDYRLAVLPSLAGWVAAVLLGFLTARRAVPQGGNLAGLVAALFIASSPAHRAYATDIMLESLGAALSLLVVYCYLLTVQGQSDETAKARCLALSLLLLFLEKYNYWLLVVLALVLAEGLTQPRLYLQALRELLHAHDWRRWIVSQLRHPMNWAIALVLLLSAIVFQHGEHPVQIFGHSVSLYPPHNLIHVGYVLAFLRMATWWRRQGRMWVRQLDSRLQQIVLWLLCPLAVWFLLPKRLSYFVWYLSFADRHPHQQLDLIGGIRDYATWMVQDYHVSLAWALLAMGLCVIGLLTWHCLRPGGVAVLTLLVLSCVLTPTHPNHKGRMLHSWIPALWVAAGLGAAALVHGRATVRVPRLRPWLGVAIVGVMTWGLYPALRAHGRAAEGGPDAALPSMLAVTDAYLPHLERDGRTLLLTTLPLKPMAQWTWLERFGSFKGLEERWYGFGADNRGGFLRWLQTTNCDTLVFCESTISRPGVDTGPECDLHVELKDILEHQRRFCLVEQRELPELGCRVRVWRRDTDSNGTQPRSAYPR